MGGGGGSASAGGGAADDTQGDRNWSSLGRQKEKRGLLVIIHILWRYATPLYVDT